MTEISALSGSDRAKWEALARAYKAFFKVEFDDAAYEQTFRRLVDGREIRGAVARLDGRMVGIAHYYFHVSVWETGDCRCYLQDLFVDPAARRRGVARDLIEWLAQDAADHGATRLTWHTTEGNTTARALYDTVGSYKGFIAYARPLNAEASASRA